MYHKLLCPSISIYILHAGLTAQSLTVSENNGTSIFVELLRGRDGLTGRDGVPGAQGPAGPSGPQGPPGPPSGGAIYTRWGKSSCPQIQGTELLYSGITGGTFFNQEGGGANHLCMPQDPEYSTTLTYLAGVQGSANIYGTEYEGPLQGTHNANVPCAVCYVSTRPTVVMIPAKASCPPTWTREYFGYIMTDYKGVATNIRGRSMFECVDAEQESLPGSHGDTNGALFYHVEADCGTGLPCPPYNNHQEVNCAVCTK